MMNNEFENFDRALLNQIMLGRNTLESLIHRETGLHQLPRTSADGNAWRRLVSLSLATSRRLQALRRKGVIDWDGMKWHLLKEK